MSQRSAYETEGKVGSAQVTMGDEMDHELSPEKAGTRLDQMDMRRMGKSQEFRVRTPLCGLESGTLMLDRSETSAS